MHDSKILRVTNFADATVSDCRPIITLAVFLSADHLAPTIACLCAFSLWSTALYMAPAVAGISAPAWMRAINPIGASKRKSPLLLDVRVAAFFETATHQELELVHLLRFKKTKMFRFVSCPGASLRTSCANE
jgi:hypothetical protein